MNYEVYKNVRNASWQCLIDCKISVLPTSLSQICKHFGIKVVGNSKLTANKLAPGEKAMKTIVNDQCYIIVDDKLSIAVQRYSIAHEIGHILLGDGEYEAERFAIDILAPACVLWGLNLHTAEDIARVCNISITSAQRRAERMRILYDRNMFLSHPLERQVFEQFRDFINNQNK